MTPEEWKAPGRKTVEGYLLVSVGSRKRDYGLFGNLVADAVEERKPGSVPRYQDLHAVWFGWDGSKPEGHQLQRPFLRYRAFQPIPGLRRGCSGHRVRLTCIVGRNWDNGLGAYITRAQGECLECDADQDT